MPDVAEVDGTVIRAILLRIAASRGLAALLDTCRQEDVVDISVTGTVPRSRGVNDVIDVLVLQRLGRVVALRNTARVGVPVIRRAAGVLVEQMDETRGTEIS